MTGSARALSCKSELQPEFGELFHLILTGCDLQQARSHGASGRDTMAFILHTSQGVAQSGVRMLSLRRVVAGACLLCSCLAGGAFALGWVLGQHFGPAQQMPGIQARQTDPVKERFTFDRLGDVSGRLLTLESEARSLVKKLTALEMLESRVAELKTGKPAVQAGVGSPAKGGAGGRVLAAQLCESAAGQGGASEIQIAGAEKTLTCLQDLLRKVEAAAATRSVNYMALPTQQPLQDQRIGSRFGNRVDPFTGRIAFHSGLDFEAESGTPIHAAGGGRVKNAGWVSELGFVIEIDHGNGLLTRYAHTSKMHVKTGDLVTPGQLIAAVGTTGRSTGPHLHFEILHNGRFVDPMYYLNIGDKVPNV
ncbi:M23 family metallopeptidase [Uliginosibacterium sp. TH139]|uniref:M23 family metallopeptidase n=1 Tax=Uliginosibacterium sp. TH139 TaxID=2067453 RepID=UPI000C79CACB|nr:M23 family metallopeptidase [Uliginosibacterium sp. TH139]PLK47747.1 peptidase M23 [Uliginosibacterium sp. TH139]